MTIWKFPFEITRTVELQMPVGAHVLHVECQQGVPCVWALVDQGAKQVVHRFQLLGSGRDIDGGAQLGRHIGTFLMHPFVWHLFEG